MTSKDKKDGRKERTEAVKAAPLKDADLDKISGGFFDTGLSGLGVKGDTSVAGSVSPNGGKTGSSSK